MDEYNLAGAILKPEELEAQAVDLSRYQKIPFAELSGLGGAIAELIPQFRTIVETTEIPMDGLFKAINPKTGKVMKDLMFHSKQVPGAFVGSLQQEGGAFDQAAFVRASAVKQTVSTVAAADPATLMLAAGIMAMSRKLDAIEEGQQRIMSFLEKDRDARLRGNLVFLLNVFTAYRTNWNNATFKASQHLKTQDIKQESEQNILFCRSMLGDDMKKRKLLVSRMDVRKSLQKVIQDLGNYRLAVYLYAFASFMEIVLLENFNAEYLRSVSGRIREEVFRYAELYTQAYTRFEDMALSSLESGAVRGAALVSRGLGKVVEKIPVVSRGRLDEDLIETGRRLEEFRDGSAEDLLASLRALRSCEVKQFVDLIGTVDELHNGEPEILVGGDALYVRTPG